MEHRPHETLITHLIEPIVILLTGWCGAIVLVGILLDRAHRLGDPTLWRLGGGVILGGSAIALWHYWRNHPPSITPLRHAIHPARPAEKLFLLTTVAILGLNLILCTILYPYNVDSAAYLLPRALYYIQHQSTDFFDANYWAQITHPVYGAYLNIAAWMLLGWEQSVNLVQYLGGVGGAVAMVGIALQLSDRILPALLAGGVFLNLTIVNLQMTTTQVELLMGGLLAGAVFFGLRWVQRPTLRYALPTALCFGLALGMKSSALLYGPALVFLLLWYQGRSLRRPFLWTFCAVLLGVLLIVFATAGYAQNLHQFGDPIGPELVYTEHSLPDISLPQRLHLGLINMVRYGSQLISLDGLPAWGWIHSIHSGLQRLFLFPFQQLGLPIDQAQWARSPFLLDQPLAQEDVSYWGVLGLLIVPALGFAWMRSLRSFLPLSLSFLIFLATQALTSQYDPWRGRYFIAGAVFAVPLVVQWWQIDRPRLMQRGVALFTSLILITASISSITTLLFREAYPLIPTQQGEQHWPSVFQLNRIEQLTRGNLPLAHALGRVGNWLDAHPQQRLYTVLPKSFPEYPLFQGQTVVPLNGFVAGFDPGAIASLPPGLLLYHDTLYTEPQPSDRAFGHHLWGRVIGDDSPPP
ncbi:hypothetical protein PN441_15040 [Spirulina major CS-329]|uniref:ArnT family glycosyltransferase n=1 Tax=Spirulina TaxID=1154 RepID=UPI00232B8ADD|nr:MULTISPECIES: hypothetical protein [Spirulina]MDB9494793.1 hypothetical protein [Spirulina subsalsa CS-330]MDB9504392.1 hypothetical protein [Spirulina major CS-329]